MIFVHYSDDHPLFTYAVYSPRTKRIIHRQDVIFLTSVFPMRAARIASGVDPDGDRLTVRRSPPTMLDGCPEEFSFGSWSPGDALPDHDDDVTGFSVTAPYDSGEDAPECLEGLPAYHPGHASFPESLVLIPIRAVPLTPEMALGDKVKDDVSDQVLDVCSGGENLADDVIEGGCLNPDETDLTCDNGSSQISLDPVVPSRRRAGQRWYLEDATLSVPVVGPTRSKRQSQPPQRLTSSKLGVVSVGSLDSRLGLFGGIACPMNMSSVDGGLSPSELVYTAPSGSRQIESNESVSSGIPVSSDPGFSLAVRQSRRSLSSSSGPPPPPHLSSVGASVATPTNRFSIRLLFPERRSPTMIFPVRGDMLVSRLRLKISELVEAINLVHLLVGLS